MTQLEIMARPPDDRATDNPWPQWSLIYRVSSAHEEGGDRVYSVNTERFVDDGDGNVKALLLHEVEMVDGALPEGRRAAIASCPPTSCCWRWASSGPSRARGWTSSASSSTSAATCGATSTS